MLLPAVSPASASLQGSTSVSAPLAKEDIPVRDLQALFDLCNERYFGGTIKPSPGFRLRVSRSVKLSGCFSFALDTRVDWGIAISSRLLDHPLAALSTMAHEMVHMLAHQRYRETGDRFYLDEEPVPGRPFVNKDHGAFFLGEMSRLNRHFPELQVDVKSKFGDGLYERDKIAPSRLLLVTIDEADGRGMVYRLHEKAPNDWRMLRQTARRLHGDGIDKVQLVEVAGDQAEGFPLLKKNNEPRAKMTPLRLKDYGKKLLALISEGRMLFEEPGTVIPMRPRGKAVKAKALSADGDDGAEALGLAL